MRCQSADTQEKKKNGKKNELPSSTPYFRHMSSVVIINDLFLQIEYHYGKLRAGQSK